MVRIQLITANAWMCEQLEEYVALAAKEVGVEYELEHITNHAEIMSAGVMKTPALAINGHVRVAGRIPQPEEIKRLLK